MSQTYITAQLFKHHVTRGCPPKAYVPDIHLSIFKLNVDSELFPPSAMPFRHPPCHSAIRHRSNFSIPSRWQAQHNAFDQPPHLIPPSATSFHHPPPHSAIRHPTPPSATPFQSQALGANFHSVKVASST